MARFELTLTKMEQSDVKISWLLPHGHLVELLSTSLRNLLVNVQSKLHHIQSHLANVQSYLEASWCQLVPIIKLCALFLLDFVLKKWANPALFSVYFQSFQSNIVQFHSKLMWKMSFQDFNSQPSDYESPPFNYLDQDTRPISCLNFSLTFEMCVN